MLEITCYTWKELNMSRYRKQWRGITPVSAKFWWNPPLESAPKRGRSEVPESSSRLTNSSLGVRSTMSGGRVLRNKGQSLLLE